MPRLCNATQKHHNHNLAGASPDLSLPTLNDAAQYHHCVFPHFTETSLYNAGTSLCTADTFLRNAVTPLCITFTKQNNLYVAFTALNYAILHNSLPSLFIASLCITELCPCYAALRPALPKRRFSLVTIPSLALLCLPSPMPCHAAHSSAGTTPNYTFTLRGQALPELCLPSFAVTLLYEPRFAATSLCDQRPNNAIQCRNYAASHLALAV